METKIFEDFNRDELREELSIWYQSVSGSKVELQRLTECLEKNKLDPATYIFEVEGNRSTMDPLAQILEKLFAADHHFAYLTVIANQQKETLAAISAKADQQPTKTVLHLAALNIEIDQQRTDLLASGVETQQQITELQKEIPQEVQVQQQLGKVQELQVRSLQEQLEKMKERFQKMERRPVTLVNAASSGSEAFAVVIGKSTTFTLLTFDGTGPWELHLKQFEAAAVHNQWSDVGCAVALTVHLKGSAEQVFAALL